MKLTNLNCPQCNGFLNQERDMFFCSSCGSAFAVDYDEHDVRYAQLVTEAERTKMLLAKDVNLMQTDYELNEQVLNNEQEREIRRERKKNARNAFSGTGTLLYALAVCMIPMLVLFGFIIFALYRADVQVSKMRDRVEEKHQTMYEMIRDDEHILENMAASGAEYIFSCRTEPVEDTRYAAPRTAYYNDDAVIDSIYVMVGKGYSSPYVMCVYSFSYTYEDTGEVIRLYDYCRFEGSSIDSYGILNVDYTPRRKSNGDDVWHAYYDKDQLLRETVMDTFHPFEANEVTVPDEWKEGHS